MTPALDNSHMISNIVIPQLEQLCQYISNAPALYYQPDIIGNSWSFPFGGLAVERTLALKTIDQFGMMDDGWDGYGAVRIHERTCKNCLQFLNTLTDNYPYPELTPNTNGTISMEWESRHGSASLEIGKTHYSFYIKRRSGGNPVLSDGDARAIGNDIAEIIVVNLYPSSHYAPSITTARYNTPGFIRLGC